MDQFDDLIKEKLEEEKHPFKRENWRAFCRVAGLVVPLSTLAILLLCFSGTLLIGAGSVAIWKINKASSSSSSSSSTYNHTSIVQKDTMAQIDDTASMELKEEKIQTIIENSATQSPVAKNSVAEESQVQAVPQPSQIESQSPASSNPPHHGIIIGKPSVISIDTIPSEN